MPPTFTDFVALVVLLIPGFVYVAQRRARVPQRTLSTTAETATLVALSMICNGIVIAAFGLLRSLLPGHTPDVGALLLEGRSYAAPRLGYLFAWAGGALLVSSALAALLGADPGPLVRLRRRVGSAAPISPASTWYHILADQVPFDHYVYVGCDMGDGAYVGGVLEWFSTAVEETGDRDLALAAPLTYRPPHDTEDRLLDVERLVVSNRDIVRMLVSYVRTTGDEPG